MLQLIYTKHLRLNKCWEQAKMSVWWPKASQKTNNFICQNYFFRWWRFVLMGLFCLHWSGLVTWPKLTPFLTLNRERGKSAFLFGRRLWWKHTAQKGALRLTAENHRVWRNFSLNKKISNGWLIAWWHSIRYPLSIAESSCQKEIFWLLTRGNFIEFQIQLLGLLFERRYL